MILPFNELIEKEALRAREKHKPINSVHEGYSVILEEMDEFWDEVKKKSSLRDPNHMLEELVQIATMARRCAEDVVIPLIEKTIDPIPSTKPSVLCKDPECGCQKVAEPITTITRPYVDPIIKREEWQATPIIKDRKGW